MNFIKYKDELINLDTCTNIYIPLHRFDGEDHLIFFRSEVERKQSKITSLNFKTKEERDEYFLKIQKRIENIQGFYVELI